MKQRIEEILSIYFGSIPRKSLLDSCDERLVSDLEAALDFVYDEEKLTPDAKGSEYYKALIKSADAAYSSLFAYLEKGKKSIAGRPFIDIIRKMIEKRHIPFAYELGVFAGKRYSGELYALNAVYNSLCNCWLQGKAVKINRTAFKSNSHPKYAMTFYNSASAVLASLEIHLNDLKVSRDDADWIIAKIMAYKDEFEKGSAFVGELEYQGAKAELEKKLKMPH